MEKRGRREKRRGVRREKERGKKKSKKTCLSSFLTENVRVVYE